MMNNKVLAPGSTIGIFGGGQLGRMLSMAAARLGFHTHIFSPQHGSPAFEVASKQTVAPYGDLNAVKDFASECDVVTVEFENIPLDTYEHAAKYTTIAPGPTALAISQDRLAEKKFLSSNDIPVAPYFEVNREADIVSAIYKLGQDGILKTRRMGYDGKGQIRLGANNDPDMAIQAYNGEPAVFEQLVNFNLELSCLAARDFSGNIVFYDCPRNVHRNQILAESHVPSNVPDDLEKLARAYTAKIAEKLNYVGVLTVEFFAVGGVTDTPLVVNELAPRVHNSGHWTMDACICDQFENHIRAVAGWQLGSPKRHSNAMMANIVGADMDRWDEVASSEGAILHLYGKDETRDGRKMGHVNYLYDID